MNDSENISRVILEKQPVWAAFPLIPWGSIGWRMGHGEGYWHDWVQWFRALTSAEQEAYQEEWTEPENWAGFYAYLLEGIEPPWVIARRERDAKQLPPTEEEHRITDPERVRWMARIYLKKTNGRGVDGSRVRDIYAAPDGKYWGLYESPPEQKEGPFLWFARYEGKVVGPDNTPLSVTIKS